MKTKLIIVVLILAAVLISTSFALQKPEDTLKIGILTPLSGELAFLGENIVRSAELALAEMGRSDILLVVEDAGGLTRQGDAVAAFRKMVDVAGVRYVIDGMSSNGTIAVAPVANELAVVFVTPLTGGENIDKAGEYIFRNGPSDIMGGTQPARDFTERFGYETVSLLTDNAEYTLDIVKHFRAAYAGEIEGDHIISPSQGDYRTDLAKVRQENPQAIFINTADGVSAPILIKQARELGLTQPIFTNFLAYGPTLLEVAGVAAEGIYVYDPEFNESAPEVQASLAKYKDTYGVASPIRFHTTGTYDAVKMGVEALDAVGEDGPALRQYLLENIQDWQGYNGSVSFDAEGNVETGFVLKQVRGGVLVTVE